VMQFDIVCFPRAAKGRFLPGNGCAQLYVTAAAKNVLLRLHIDTLRLL
jgi:hypothetical protein